MMKHIEGSVFALCAVLLAGGPVALSAQTFQTTDIPVKKVALFSSGVAFFEHSGTVRGDAQAALQFDLAAVDDVLKSLVIGDSEAVSPSVSYSSEDTLSRTLKSLKIDLSGNPGMAELLSGLRGAELRVSVPTEITGRIVGVEMRGETEKKGAGAWLSLSTKDGLRVIALSEISAFSFTDRKIAADLERALDLILSSRDTQTRTLQVNLPGKGERNVTLGYVIASPVWKASYRLDLAGDKPLLQGWAIVDNAGNMDWNGVELSLVTGRPVSFIQKLYAPLYLSRPVLPLSIAGIAEAQTYDSGYDSLMDAEESAAPMAEMAAPAPSAVYSSAKAYGRGAEAPEKQKSVAGGTIETAVARSAGDQFEFTVRNPVTLSRQRSAMIPLVESPVKAEKISVFSGTKAQGGGMIHPMLCAELSNSTGMKLPAGPITVFDDGLYAGDALIEFFPENDKRIIAFGEDLSVTGSVTPSSSQETVGVTVTKGIMTITRRYTHIKTYTFRNASSRARTVVVEHPVTQGSTLVIPAAYRDKTDSLYRFNLSLGANAEARLEVKEQSPVQETVALSQLRLDSYVYYTSSRDIPQKVKASLEKAVEFKRKADDAKTAQSALEAKRAEKIAEQDRIRKNLQAAGNDSQQGKDYLKKLTQADNDIDSLAAQIEGARKSVVEAQKAYENYLSTLTLE